MKVLGREFEGEPFFKRVSLNESNSILHQQHIYSTFDINL